MVRGIWSLVLGALVLVSLPGQAMGAPAKPKGFYKNERFGYTMRYPGAQFVPQPESDNGDGRRFVSLDSQTVLTVWGEEGLRDLDDERSFIEDNLKDAGARVTYVASGGAGFVLAGFKRGNQRAFYERHTLVGRPPLHRWLVWTIEYPRMMDDLVEPAIASKAIWLAPPEPPPPRNREH